MHYSNSPVRDTHLHHASFLLLCTFPPIQWPTKVSRDHATRAHEQHAFSHVGKDLEIQCFVEKGMAEPSPWLFLTRHTCPGLLEGPQQHHGQLHSPFKLVLLPEEAFPPLPSHLSLNFVLVQVLQPHRSGWGS